MALGPVAHVVLESLVEDRGPLGGEYAFRMGLVTGRLCDGTGRDPG